MRFRWDSPTDPTGNVQHILRHGLTPGIVEALFQAPDAVFYPSERLGRWLVEATHLSKVYRAVFERVGTNEIYPVTAHRLEAKRRNS